MYNYVLSRDGFPDQHLDSYRKIGKFFGKSGQHIHSLVSKQKKQKEIFLYGWKFKKIPRERKIRYTKKGLLRQIFDEIDKNGTLKLKQLAKTYKEKR